VKVHKALRQAELLFTFNSLYFAEGLLIYYFIHLFVDEVIDVDSMELCLTKNAGKKNYTPIRRATAADIQFHKYFFKGEK
jgi:hypothetical protein